MGAGAFPKKESFMENNNVSAFHPSTRLYRFCILLFISLVTFGSYFAYDIIGAMADTQDRKSVV